MSYEKRRSVSRVRDGRPLARGTVAAIRPWRWSLTSLLLVMGIVAAWTPVIMIGRQNQRLRSEIETMMLLASELQVSDSARYAVVRRPERWFNENIWKVYLPEGRDYRLYLVTREIDRAKLPLPFLSARLTTGYHMLEYQTVADDNGSWRILVLVNGETIMDFAETNDWETSSSFSSLGGYTRSTQIPTDEPLVLERKRFHREDARTGGSREETTANGVLLWIEAE